MVEQLTTSNSTRFWVCVALLSVGIAAGCNHPHKKAELQWSMADCMLNAAEACRIRMEAFAAKIESWRDHTNHPDHSNLPEYYAEYYAGPVDDGGRTNFLVNISGRGRTIVIVEQCGHTVGNLVYCKLDGVEEMALMPRKDVAGFWRDATNGQIRVRQKWKDSFVRWQCREEIRRAKFQSLGTPTVSSASCGFCRSEKMSPCTVHRVRSQPQAGARLYKPQQRP